VWWAWAWQESLGFERARESESTVWSEVLAPTRACVRVLSVEEREREREKETESTEEEKISCVAQTRAPDPGY